MNKMPIFHDKWKPNPRQQSHLRFLHNRGIWTQNNVNYADKNRFNDHLHYFVSPLGCWKTKMFIKLNINQIIVAFFKPNHGNIGWHPCIRLMVQQNTRTMGGSCTFMPGILQFNSLIIVFAHSKAMILELQTPTRLSQPGYQTALVLIVKAS